MLPRITSRLIMQKARRHPSRGLRLLVSKRFQVLLTLLAGVLFTFPSRYWFTIGRRGVFSLGRWSSQLPTGFHVPRGTRESQPSSSLFAYRSLTSYGSAFQHDSAKFRRLMPGPTTPETPKRPGFGLFPFRSPLLRKSIFFLFLRVLRWFTSPSSLPPPMNSVTDDPDFSRPGFPIRTSPDLRLLAASRGFSQLTTSFIASLRQGIHRLPLVA